MFVLDYIEDSYSQILAIGNFITFAGLIGCCVLVYLAAVIGQFDRYWKHTAIGAIIYIVAITVAHWYLVEYFGITLLVPPIGTPYFAEFLPIMQFAASVSFVVLFGVICVLAILGRLDHQYHGQFVSAFLILGVLWVLHSYINERYGIPLIFPPNLW